METIEVTAHFDTQGRITPLSFVWKDSTFRIEGTGRRWEAKDGKHMLVMVAGNRAFHLTFDCRTAVWKLIRSSEKPTVPTI
jgi:hypothetical protein